MHKVVFGTEREKERQFLESGNFFDRGLADRRGGLRLIDRERQRDSLRETERECV